MQQIMIYWQSIFSVGGEGISDRCGVGWCVMMEGGLGG